MADGFVTFPRIGWGTIIIILAFLGVKEPDLQVYAWCLAGFVFVYGGMVSLTTLILKSPKDGLFRTGLLEVMSKTRAPIESYRLLLGRALDWIDEKLGDDSTLKQGRNENLPWWKRFGRNFPFSIQSYDFLLRAALVYPLIFVVISLSIVGLAGDGFQGAFSIPQISGYPVLSQLIFVLSFICTLAALIKALGIITRKWHKRPLFAAFAVAVAFAFAFAFAFAVAFAFAFAGDGDVAFAFAVAVAFAFAGDGAGAVAGAFAGAVAFAVAGAFAVAFAGTVAGTVAGAFAFAVAVAVAVAFAFAFAGAFAFAACAGAGAVAVAGAGAFAGAVAGAGAVAVAGAVAYLSNRFYQAQKPPVKIVFRLIEWPLLIGLCWLVASWRTHAVLGDFSKGFSTIALVTLYLPLINVIFDFVSFMLTRGLLRCSLRSDLRGWQVFQLPFFALADLIVALVTMILLVMAMVVAIGLLNYFSGGSAYALDTMVSTLSDHRLTKNYWIYATLFSTLLPTLIHFMIGSIGFSLGVLSWFNITRDWAVRWLQRDKAWRYPELQIVPHLVTILAILVLAVVIGFPALVFSNLGLFEWFFKFLVGCAWFAAAPFGYSPPA